VDARGQLRQTIDQLQGRLAAGIPPDREAALLALVATIDRLPEGREDEPRILAGPGDTRLGASTALPLCLAPGKSGVAASDLLGWASGFLEECRGLEAARLALRFADSGAMRLAVRPDGGVDAWLGGRRIPALSRERADIAAWARSLSDEVRGDDGAAAVARIGYQLPYPPDAEVCGLPLAVCRMVVSALTDMATAAGHANGQSLLIDEKRLAGEIAGSLGLDGNTVRSALSALTLDAGNAGWHAVLPSGPLSPLIRVAPGRLVIARRGLRTEPFFFLLRELRRRDPERYHNGAYQREDAFRSDLYARFGDSRFVASPGRILLRRDDRRSRTDIDAAIFDRKTGTLALMELKAQDPFARTVEELERQLEQLRRAGRQVAAVLDWINRNGADEVLNRMDRGIAKRFRVHRVLSFVLGRYLGEWGGEQRKGRIAAGSWGQVLRLLDRAGDANPLLSLHGRLMDDERSDLLAPSDAPPVEFPLGERRLVVRVSWNAAPE
jgi:hypothetical protein